MPGSQQDAARGLPRVLAIVGPTASGKSEAAMDLAGRMGARIFACDSVQVYRGLDIGSAKASDAQRASVVHELIDIVEPDAEFSAGAYARAAHRAIANSEAPVILCGGTGLYLRAFAWTQPEHMRGDLSREDPQRLEFERLWESKEVETTGAVHAELARRDPATATAIHPRNVVRALRALWLCERHRAPISELRAAEPSVPRIDLLCVVLEPEPDRLRARILARCDEMMARGWLGEVEKLLAAGYHLGHKSMRSLGYKQLCAHLGGDLPLVAARAQIESDTWAYARRQRTWFRHQLPPERTIHCSRFDDLSAAQLCRVEAFVAGTGSAAGSQPHS